MPRVYRRIARKEWPDAKVPGHTIKKGDLHYAWTLYKQPTRRSIKVPTRADLTGSGWLKGLYGLQDQVEKAVEHARNQIEDLQDEDGFPDDVKEVFDTLQSEVQTLYDEAQESWDSLEEGMGYEAAEASTSGQTLQERMEALESWIDALGNVDFAENAGELRDALQEIENEEPGL